MKRILALVGLFCSFTLIVQMHAQKIDRKTAVKKGKVISGQPIEKSTSLLDMVGYYLGGKTNADGKFEATFLIERKGEDKDNWPTVTVTGNQYRELYKGLDRYHRVALNLAEGHNEPPTSNNGVNAGAEQQDWDAEYERLMKQPAMRNKILQRGATKERVIEFLKKQAEGKNGKGKTNERKKTNVKPGARKGSVKFYSIVIGRLRSKDIELGELEIDVDYVISDPSQINADLVGERVRLVGVAGQFLDSLLQIRRGETIKVRTGDFNPSTKVLGFGYKFQVLERTAPFKPGDFGVPPDEFRGFRGELVGKIVEAAGYEVLLDVQKSNPANDSKAADADCILGNRIRIAGFYGQHSDAFADLHEGDMIRVSVGHRNTESDALNVTDLLERVEN